MPVDPFSPFPITTEERASSKLVELDRRARGLERNANALDTKGAYTFSNGWRAFGGGAAPWNTAGFYKSGGVVFLEGLLDKNGGNWLAAEVILTLPAGFRPQATRAFGVLVSGGAGAGIGRIDVDAGGVLTLVLGASANPVGYLSLDGVCFRAGG